MNDNRNYCNYHGKFINNRIIKDLTLSEAVYAPDSILSDHLHRNPSFCLVLQGGYVESYGKISLNCQPFKIKFQPAGEPHSDFYGKKTVRSFIIELESEWLARTGADALVGNIPFVFRNNSLTWLMMKLRQELHSSDVEASFATEGLVLELIAETSRSKVKLLESEFSGGEPQWLKRAKELLDDQFSESLTLSAIAAEAGVHPVYLASSFRRHYGCSVGEYLRRRRVEFAGRLISNSYDSLADIALSAGFSNQAHFFRIFKQMTGMSPARFRAANRVS